MFRLRLLCSLSLAVGEARGLGVMARKMPAAPCGDVFKPAKLPASIGARPGGGVLRSDAAGGVSAVEPRCTRGRLGCSPEETMPAGVGGDIVDLRCSVGLAGGAVAGDVVEPGRRAGMEVWGLVDAVDCAAAAGVAIGGVAVGGGAEMGGEGAGGGDALTGELLGNVRGTVGAAGTAGTGD